MVRKLIITADDFGITRGICEGILRASDGVLTGTTVLANSRYIEQYRETLGNSDLDVGIHLALVGEDPLVSNPRDIPTLVNDRGQCAEGWTTLLMGMCRGAIDHGDIRREWNAQLDRCDELGYKISHITTHQHVHLWPSIGRIAVELAEERGIPAVRVPTTQGVTPKAWFIRRLSHRLAMNVGSAGLFSPALSLGIDDAGALDTTRLCNRIVFCASATTIDDVLEITCHPGDVDDELDDRFKWQYSWQDELTALMSAQAKDQIARSDVELTTYRDAFPVT